MAQKHCNILTEFSLDKSGILAAENCGVLAATAVYSIIFLSFL